MGNIYEMQKNILNELTKRDFYLKDSDFYPPADTRVLYSLIEDINEGNNYLEYAEHIYDLYEEEDYYEN